jgi:hypothetical protein
VRSRGRIDPVFVQHPRDLVKVLPDLLRDGDLLLLQGAGDIGAVRSRSPWPTRKSRCRAAPDELLSKNGARSSSLCRPP